MKGKIQELKLENSDLTSNYNSKIILNKVFFVNFLSELKNLENLNLIKKKIYDIKLIVERQLVDDIGLTNIVNNGETITLKRKILVDELEQILSSQTTERVKYYIRRLINAIQKEKTNKINDINLTRWKEYEEIITDSLWILDKRDTSGAHLGWYWGNFVPQIPRQIMWRYTKQNDWVLDPFAGSGTTLIECRRLGRNGIGIELNPDVAEKSRELIEKEVNKNNVITEIIVGDSRKFDIKSILDNYNVKKIHLIIMHPPYHDIIKFSNDKCDLSNAKDTKEFLKMFGEVVDNVTPFLEKDRYFALVIGDKYSKGEWIPLGFYCMEEVLKRNYSLKSIIVKNFDETRGKRNQQELWRYRALVGGFYIFKHEYIMLFKKK